MAGRQVFFKTALRALPDVFTIKNMPFSERTNYRYLDEMLKKGHVVTIEKGLYAKKSASPYKVAFLYYMGHISFSSALYIHGLKTESEKKIYISVNRPKKRMVFQGLELIPVLFKKFLFSAQEIKGITVTTYPKTVFDMFHKPKYADFYCLYRALNWKPMAEDEWRELLKMAQMAPLSTVRRLGYGLEGKAPEWFIKELEKLNAPKGVSFFVPGVSEGYSKKWRIYEPNHIRRWINEY